MQTLAISVISESLYVAIVLFLSVYPNCVISIILSPRLLMNSSVGFQSDIHSFYCVISAIEFFLIGSFLYFSNSLLKCLLCTSTLLPNSVNILLPDALNSLSGKLFIHFMVCFFFFLFFLLFQLKVVPLPFHFA